MALKGGKKMESLNDLISLAQSILDSGYDVQAFLNWQTLAFSALVAIVGPYHYYTQNFKRLTSEKSPRGLLAGEGILLAAKEQIQKPVELPGESELVRSSPPGSL